MVDPLGLDPSSSDSDVCAENPRTPVCNLAIETDAGGNAINFGCLFSCGSFNGDAFFSDGQWGAGNWMPFGDDGLCHPPEPCIVWAPYLQPYSMSALQQMIPTASWLNNGGIAGGVGGGGGFIIGPPRKRPFNSVVAPLPGCGQVAVDAFKNAYDFVSLPDGPPGLPGEDADRHDNARCGNKRRHLSWPRPSAQVKHLPILERSGGLC